MRTLSSTSRALCAAAIAFAAVLILGGAYFVGYVGEVQRDLSDPAQLRRDAAAEITIIEKSLGYGGFLKSYASYRLTGEARAKPQMTNAVDKARRALNTLRTLYGANASASDALREAAAVVDTFAHIATIAPQIGDGALRGSASMDALSTLPQSPQLEATYLSLRSALDRVRQADIEHQLGGAAVALNWSQMLIMGALALVVIGLVIFAALLQLGIVQPLKSLERSLTSVGDGAVNQPVWGVDRADEFGALARAGEKVRQSLTETSALKTLAQKGQLHVTLESGASVLFEKLAADVTSATQALRNASADIARLQDDNRRQFQATLAGLSQSGAGFSEVANALRDGAASAIDDIRISAADIRRAAEKRDSRFDEIAMRFDQTGQVYEETVARVSERTDAAANELAAASAAFKGAANNAHAMQSEFAKAMAKLATDAAGANETTRTLAARLSATVGAFDEGLARKLAALDALDKRVTEILAKLEERGREAVATFSAVAEGRDRLAGEHQAQLATALERLQAIAAPVNHTAPTAAPSQAPDLDAFAKAMRAESDAIRAEIRDLAVRLTEDRLLATADIPFLGAKADGADAAPRRTLADVPGAEIMARLQNLAAEMNAAQTKLDHVASLKDALTNFATEVKQLAANADRAARLKNMGKALDRHADEIDARASAIDPSADGLRGEALAITNELRTIAARAQATGVKEAPTLREAAIHLGERAQSLFARLDDLPDDAADGEPVADPIHASEGDLIALTQLIGRLETRAEGLARSVLASRFGDAPGAARDHGPARELKTDEAIHTVFASIERLNNIAAALARAGDADRQRRAAH